MSDIRNIPNNPFNKRTPLKPVSKGEEEELPFKGKGEQAAKNVEGKGLFDRTDLYTPSKQASGEKPSSGAGKNTPISKEDLDRFVKMAMELPDEEMSADEIGEIQTKMERYGEEALQGTVDRFLEEEFGVPPRR